MRNAFLQVCPLIIAVVSGPPATALTIELDGPRVLALGQRATLDVVIDTSPENYTFVAGLISISVESLTPDVINFVDAGLLNPEFFGGSAQRWTAVGVDGISNMEIANIQASAISAVGLNGDIPGNAIVDGGTRFLFAQVEIEANSIGVTELRLGFGQVAPPFFSSGADVTADVVFRNFEITVVPEPATSSLAGIAMWVLYCRRRRVAMT